MTLTTIDWVIIAAYFILSLAIGLYYYRRAGESMGEFFVAGRDLPWWLAGTSMVAISSPPGEKRRTQDAPQNADHTQPSLSIAMPSGVQSDSWNCFQMRRPESAPLARS